MGVAVEIIRGDFPKVGELATRRFLEDKFDFFLWPWVPSFEKPVTLRAEGADGYPYRETHYLRFERLPAPVWEPNPRYKRVR
jgi:hypothetical protein